MAVPTASLADDRAITRAAAAAARTVPGVHALGTAAARRFAGAVSAASGSETDAGVRVQHREVGTAVTVTVVVEYPRNVREVADRVRADVLAALGAVTVGRVDVDVVVADVHGPFDPAEEEGEEQPPAAETAAAPEPAAAVPAARASAATVPTEPVSAPKPASTTAEHIRPATPVPAEERVAVVGERAAGSGEESSRR